MRDYGWEIIDKESNKIISLPGNWRARFTGEDVGGLQRLNKEGSEFDGSNLYLSQLSKDNNMIDLSSKRMFSKVFHLSPTSFSQPSFHGYWYNLVLKLSPYTNAIYIHKDKRKVYAHTKSDLIEICNTSRTTFYKFYNEAYQKNYIKPFGDNDDDRLYILNPKYALNGNKMFKDIYILFKESRKDIEIS